MTLLMSWMRQLAPCETCNQAKVGALADKRSGNFLKKKKVDAWVVDEPLGVLELPGRADLLQGLIFL